MRRSVPLACALTLVVALASLAGCTGADQSFSCKPSVSPRVGAIGEQPPTTAGTGYEHC